MIAAEFFSLESVLTELSAFIVKVFLIPPCELALESASSALSVSCPPHHFVGVLVAKRPRALS